jgi:Cu(I)/Ag(I) efflux system membrane fusion protein
MNRDFTNMTTPSDPRPPEHHDFALDEGGLRAPPGLGFWGKAWWWFDFVILVKLARLRFIAILAAIGVVITQWDTLVAYYDKWMRPATAASAIASDTEYFCPMHPTVIRDNGREKCPICFMPLSKRKKGEQTDEVLPAGIVNRVQLSPYRIVLAGIQSWEISEVPLTKEIQAVGYVEFNERGLKNVSARVKGRIDELLVNETGQMVSSGDLLASLYSPDLNVTVQNLLDAKRRNSTEAIASSRQRLELLGIGDDQIDDVLKTGKANSHLRIRSPISGHVIKKYVREGQYVEEGSPLYDVADLSSIWIQAQIYEDDMVFLPFEQEHKLAEALPVSATTRAFPGEEFRGSLTFIYPHVDQQSRTVTVRFELPNPGHKLRPGMTTTVILLVPPERVPALRLAAATDEAAVARLKEGRVLALPESAVIQTGSETIIYREALPGTYEGVLVTLGPKMTGPNNVTFYPIIQGLEAGDRIATSGSFLVDAETRLNPAAGSIYFGGSSGSKSGGGSVTTVRPTTPENEDAKLQAAMKKLTPEDRAIAEKQKYCPILENSRLGSMGVPVKVMVDGKAVFVCCPACEKPAKDKPQETLQKLEQMKSSRPGRGSTPMSVSPGKKGNETESKIQATLAKLSPQDRKLAEQQRACVVLPNSLLGSMGVPPKLTIDGETVFVCCAGCEKAARANPKETLKRLTELKDHSTSAADDLAKLKTLSPKIQSALSKLSPADLKIVLQQKLCPVMDDSPLGSMGVPVKIMLDEQAVFLCCEGCEELALKKPKETLARVKELKQAVTEQKAEPTP